MLRSKNDCYAADDVTIRCRVRHSLQAATRTYSDPQEMTCTMRVWRRTRTPTAAAVVREVGVKHVRSFDFSNRRHKDDNGPELVLKPNQEASQHPMVHACCSGDFAEPIPLSERFTSFGSGANLDKNRTSGRIRRTMTSTPKAAVVGDETIPVSEIMVVDMFGGGDVHQCNITTMSKGYFEFTMENRNGQDILLAFLKANVPQERVMEALNHRTGSQLSGNSVSTGATGKSYDVEAFTATRMAERMENETISEKFRRKVFRVFSSFEEMSMALSECTCGCTKDSISPAPPSHNEKRDSPPPEYEHLEAAPDHTPERTMQYIPDETIAASGMYKDCQLPSGLSVEAEEASELGAAVY